MGVLDASQLVAFPEVKFYLTLKGIEGVFTWSVRAIKPIPSAEVVTVGMGLPTVAPAC